MKILIITSGFFPGRKYGGPPVSVDNFCSLLTGAAECFIVTHNHDLGEQIPYTDICKGWNNRGNAQVLYLTDEEYNAAGFENAIKEVKPNFLYLQSLFQSCVIPCLKLAKKYHIKVVLAPRGELCKGAFRKKYKKLPYIYFLRFMRLTEGVLFQSTSSEESFAIRKYLNARQDDIYYLTNIPSFARNLSGREIKKEGEGRFIFISRIVWKKNLLKAISLFQTIKGYVIFDVYGPKEDVNYWIECEKACMTLPHNIKVEYKGILSHDDIHATFSKYDAFLFPTLSENYGHVISEALASRCIPIISDQTPWNDINECGAGWAIPLSNEEQFRDAIQEVVDMDEKTICLKRENIKTYLNGKFELEMLKADYMHVFN